MARPEFNPKIARYDYVKYEDPRTKTEIKTMYCKACGRVIANMQYRPIGNDQEALTYTRLANYCEAKFRCEDGHFHVTNGCKRCLRMDMDLEVADGMHDADLREMGMKPCESPVVEVVAIDISGEGLV